MENHAAYKRRPEGLGPALKQDRSFTHERVAQFVRIGKPLLEGSGLVIKDAVITPRDVQITRELIQKLAPVTIDNYTLHEHLQLAAKTARKIGDKLKSTQPFRYFDINLDELEVLALLHDSGRFVTHRFYRNDLVGAHMLKRMGVREDLINNIPHEDLFMGKDPSSEDQARETVNGYSLKQKIIEMADFYSKRKDDGGILTFKEVLEYNSATRSGTNYEKRSGQPPIWASERKRNQAFVDYSNEVYPRLRQWFLDEGVNLDEVREEILVEEQQSQIRAVVFDGGNVIFYNPDKETVEDIQEAFEVSSAAIQPVWEELIDQLGRGQLSEDAFWNLFAKRLGKEELPPNHKSLLTSRLPRERYPYVESLLDELKQKGYLLAVHSDTVVPDSNVFREAGIYNGFDEVILSHDIKARKTQKEAFKIAALRLWLPPQACLLIDDREAYGKTAESARMKFVHFDASKQESDDLRVALTGRKIL